MGGRPGILLDPRLTIAVLGLSAAAIFAPTLSFDFVYDDGSQILANPWLWHARHLPELLTKAVWSFKGDLPSNYYRPIQMLLYFIDAQLFGRSPFGFHLTNVLIHVAATIAGFILLREVTGERRAAAAALLFAVHPAHVESVAWIAGSTDVNCAVLMFACLWAWSRSHAAAGRRRATLTVVTGMLFLAALLAKETAVVIPALALAMPPGTDRAGTPRPLPRLMSRKATRLAVVSACVLPAYLLLRWHALGGLSGFVRHPELSPAGIVANALALIPRYLLVAFPPWTLVPDRVFEPASGMLDPWCLAGTAIMVIGLLLAVWLRRSAPSVVFGIALMLVPLLPVLQVQYVGINVQADRYLYVPSLGVCLLIAEAAASIARHRATGPGVRRAVVMAGALFVLAAAVRTVNAAGTWKNDQTLARAAIALEPRSITMRVLLATTLDRAGRTDEAANVAEAAAALDPHNPDAAASVAALRAQRDAKSPEEQVSILRAALVENPVHPYLWASLSAACVRARLFDQAVAAAKRALALDPHNAAAIVNLASARGGLRDYAGQEAEARRALEIAPTFPLAWLSLGEARFAMNDVDGYEEAARRAAELDPTMARAHVGLALVALRRGRTDDALHEAERAAQLDPADVGAWALVGAIRDRRGDRDGARLAWERILVLAPGHPVALRNLQRP